MRLRLETMLSKTKVIADWKNGQWTSLIEWCEDVNLADLVQHARSLPHFLRLERDDKLQQFEMILALIFGEYYKATRELLQCEEFSPRDAHYAAYMQQLGVLKRFLGCLYFELIFTYEVQQGETAFFYKLFLHVLYEIESLLHFLRDVFVQPKVLDALKREVVARRKFEKVYLECDLSEHFEGLLGWLEQRTRHIA